MRVFGATAASPDVTETPATTRFSKVDPFELLDAPLPLRVLVALAITSLAVIRPLKRATFATEAMLCALVASTPAEPTVLLFRKLDESTSEALSASAEAVEMSPSVTLDSAA